jgi:hypothetical protein
MASLMIMVERHLYVYMSLFVIIMIVPWDISPKGSPIRSISLLVELSYLYIREESVLVLYSVLTILK